jgi:hypothetical protein
MRSTLLAAGFILTMATAAQAQPGFSVSPRGQPMAGSSAACESARLSAWFERQRQLTDGDVDPSKGIAVPRECTAMNAGQARGDAMDKGTAEATAQRESPALAATREGARAY